MVNPSKLAASTSTAPAAAATVEDHPGRPFVFHLDDIVRLLERMGGTFVSPYEQMAKDDVNLAAIVAAAEAGKRPSPKPSRVDELIRVLKEQPKQDTLGDLEAAAAQLSLDEARIKEDEDLAAALQTSDGNFPPKVKATITPGGFTCGNCGHVNQIQATAHAHTIVAPTEPHYCVSVGLEVGVFGDWNDVSPMVTGVSGAVHKKWPTKAIAQAAFNDALACGKVRLVV